MARLVPLERNVEEAFLRMVKTLRIRIRTRKMNGLGFAGWPDRLIVGPNRFVMFIEFKRLGRGNRLTEGQKGMFAELDAMDHPVSVHTSAKEAFDDLIQRLRDHGIQV